MSNTGNNLRWNPLREVAFGTVTNSFVLVSPEVTIPLRFIIFDSSLNQDIYISFNGVDANLRLFINSFRLLDLKTNDAFIENQNIYVKYVGAAPDSGVLSIATAWC